MKSPRRIQRKRTKGWKIPEGAICVDRSTKWGNPFVIGKRKMTRAEVVFSHNALMHGYINVSCDCSPGIQELYAAYVRQNIYRLRGKDLACWCPLNQPCHADVLLELANAKGR